MASTHVERESYDEVIRLMLSKKDQEYFKSLLNQRIEELLVEKRQTVTNAVVNGEEVFDFGDQATAEHDRAFGLRVQERNRNLIRKIMDALERLKDGTYGICEECGEWISERRLQARPTASLCIKCKEKEERAEKQFGFSATEATYLSGRKE